MLIYICVWMPSLENAFVCVCVCGMYVYIFGRGFIGFNLSVV